MLQNKGLQISSSLTFIYRWFIPIGIVIGHIVAEIIAIIYAPVEHSDLYIYGIPCSFIMFSLVGYQFTRLRTVHLSNRIIFVENGKDSFSVDVSRIIGIRKLVMSGFYEVSFESGDESKQILILARAREVFMTYGFGTPPGIKLLQKMAQDKSM